VRLFKIWYWWFIQKFPGNLISVCIHATEPLNVSLVPSASTENITVIISFSCTIILTVTWFDPFVSDVMLFGTWKRQAHLHYPSVIWDDVFGASSL
jgi:hypothetical protein